MQGSPEKRFTNDKKAQSQPSGAAASGSAQANGLLRPRKGGGSAAGTGTRTPGGHGCCKRSRGRYRPLALVAGLAEPEIGREARRWPMLHRAWDRGLGEPIRADVNDVERFCEFIGHFQAPVLARTQ